MLAINRQTITIKGMTDEEAKNIRNLLNIRTRQRVQRNYMYRKHAILYVKYLFDTNSHFWTCRNKI